MRKLTINLVTDEWMRREFEIDVLPEDIQDIIDDFNADLERYGIEPVDITPEDVMKYFADEQCDDSIVQKIEHQYKKPDGTRYDFWFDNLEDYLRDSFDQWTWDSDGEIIDGETNSCDWSYSISD